MASFELSGGKARFEFSFKTARSDFFVTEVTSCYILLDIPVTPSRLAVSLYHHLGRAARLSPEHQVLKDNVVVTIRYT